MSRVHIIFAMILGLAWSYRAEASGFVHLGAMYMTESVGSGSSTSDAERTLLDVGGGYISPKGWVAGFMYGTEKYERTGSDSNRTSIGPTLGWVSRKDNGPYVLGSYFLTLKMSPGDYKGNGTQFDIGYKFQIDRVAFAAQISKKNFTYTEGNGANLNPNFVDNKLDPYFVVWIEF